ncbi:hypothetical protein [Phaffia rhodozyma]|uniref:Uncharacterized protein n=1 Tax=Phaffia rhodozyma TaxID=264483 RepID=A0A0F7SYU3_PHARH|nr:hypothetical protein [Phaffia rhodozyma]
MPRVSTSAGFQGQGEGEGEGEGQAAGGLTGRLKGSRKTLEIMQVDRPGPSLMPSVRPEPRMFMPSAPRRLQECNCTIRDAAEDAGNEVHRSKVHGLELVGTMHKERESCCRAPLLLIHREYQPVSRRGQNQPDVWEQTQRVGVDRDVGLDVGLDVDVDVVDVVALSDLLARLGRVRETQKVRRCIGQGVYGRVLGEFYSIIWCL